MSTPTFVFRVQGSPAGKARAHLRDFVRQGKHIVLDFSHCNENNFSASWVFSAFNDLYEEFGSRQVDKLVHVRAASAYVLEALRFAFSYMQTIEWPEWAVAQIVRVTVRQPQTLYRIPIQSGPFAAIAAVGA